MDEPGHSLLDLQPQEGRKGYPGGAHVPPSSAARAEGLRAVPLRLAPHRESGMGTVPGRLVTEMK